MEGLENRGVRAGWEPHTAQPQSHGGGDAAGGVPRCVPRSRAPCRVQRAPPQRRQLTRASVKQAEGRAARNVPSGAGDWDPGSDVKKESSPVGEKAPGRQAHGQESRHLWWETARREGGSPREAGVPSSGHSDSSGNPIIITPTPTDLSPQTAEAQKLDHLYSHR